MEADLLVVGGGPAGCAAAVMAASLGMRSVLVESGDALCGALRRIPVVNNVLGFTTGPGMAAAIKADVEGCDLCRVALGRRATRIEAFEDRVEVTVQGPGAAGARLTAPYAVVATGVGPLAPAATGWLSGAEGRELPQLWEADAAAITGRTVLVLGADRPLGTLTRAHPGLRTRFLVAHPPEDTYKTEEIGQDARVELVAVRRLELGPPSAPPRAEALTVAGERRALTADLVFLNLGSAPAPPAGSLVTGGSGYCPPGRQPPRIRTAGDLRSARFQRIATAMGSGSEAALSAYYAARGLATDGVGDG
ncbi:FAD-dependent oxidoreductase [Streptomyces sp. NPDC019937]|uniref:FAD-dependent oxidoreductase n=1 Tax=Streptomyces sp. NPDC019937 TaxID=3154787 RepID=UPI0033C019F9